MAEENGMVRLSPVAAREKAELETFIPDTDLPLDPGIKWAVAILRRAGVETFESCEGGADHTFPEPTVRFFGTPWAGYHAFAVAMEHGLPVAALRRSQSVVNGELEGPSWEMTFARKVERFHEDYDEPEWVKARIKERVQGEK